MGEKLLQYSKHPKRVQIVTELKRSLQGNALIHTLHIKIDAVCKNLMLFYKIRRQNYSEMDEIN